MIIETQMIDIKWSTSNKCWYESKGYVFTSYKDVFKVNVLDLPHNSGEHIGVICDCCNEKFYITYHGYCKKHDKYDHDIDDFCDECKKKIRIYNLYSKAIEACNKKGYKLLSDKSDIKNNVTYVKYLCKHHGEQSMRISNLISGRNCPQCKIDAAREKYKINPDEVEKRVCKCGGELINKNDYKNQYEKNLIILCPRCKNAFTTSLVLFTQHGGQVCKECYSSESIGEMKIRKYLEENKILFQQEKWFPDCRDVNPLPFDFYLLELNTIIEFDGRQHFEETNHFTYSFQTVKKHDNIKNNYCLINNINLIRIPYTEINHISEILNEKLNNLHEDIV